MKNQIARSSPLPKPVFGAVRWEYLILPASGGASGTFQAQAQSSSGPEAGQPTTDQDQASPGPNPIRPSSGPAQLNPGLAPEGWQE